MKTNKFDIIFGYFQGIDNNIEKYGKVLGTGGFGEVKEVIYKDQRMAAKLTEKKENQKENKKDGFSYINKLKGPHIVKIHKILEIKFDDKDYNLIIMEKAFLRDLKKMIIRLHEKNNMLKLINKPFFELSGNNFVKYYSKQIIKGLETLDRNDLVHFDIKPENILIVAGLRLKISDFSFLMNVQENQKVKIPGGTPGYITPEYFKNEDIDQETAKKQDYFALGTTLFLLKIGSQMLEYKKYDDNTMTEDRIIDLLQRDITFLRTFTLFNRDFIEFLCSLINYVPEERPNFEEIYRNKWVNQNLDEIDEVKRQFVDGDEDKMINELIKSDFYLEKQKKIKKDEKKRNNFIFVE